MRRAAGHLGGVTSSSVYRKSRTIRGGGGRCVRYDSIRGGKLVASLCGEHAFAQATKPNALQLKDLPASAQKTVQETLKGGASTLSDRRQSRAATTAAASAELITGWTSKSTMSVHWAIH